MWRTVSSCKGADGPKTRSPVVEPEAAASVRELKYDRSLPLSSNRSAC